MHLLKCNLKGNGFLYLITFLFSMNKLKFSNLLLYIKLNKTGKMLFGDWS